MGQGLDRHSLSKSGEKQQYFVVPDSQLDSVAISLLGSILLYGSDSLALGFVILVVTMSQRPSLIQWERGLYEGLYIMSIGASWRIRYDIKYLA